MADRLTREQLEIMLSDARAYNGWRAEADEAAMYYDGKQLPPRLMALYRERGLAPLIRNMIGPTIDLVLGIEAKNRRDFKTVADVDADVDVADAMSFKLKQAERVSEADTACSDAYGSAVKAGIGWIEVAREADPFRPAYRVRAIHRNEIVWDMRSKENNLADARYLIRERWVDVDVAELKFPKKRALIRRAAEGFPDWADAFEDIATNSLLLSGRETESLTTLRREEWCDTERQRVRLFEVWYRRWVQGVVASLPSGRVVAIDEKNPRHLALVASGTVPLRPAVFSKVRLAWWCGPHFLADIPSPYPHGFFPYVPVFGYREDAEPRAPYGLCRRMMSPQDEVNARLMRMMWLLSAKRVVVDSDALDMPHTEMVEEVARPDAVIYLNPHRKNRDAAAFQIESDFQLSQQQFQVLQDAKGAIQDSAGVYQSMLGKSEYAGQSGLAISNLVEQGSTTLANINRNYSYARRQVGLLMLSLITEDIGRAPTTVTVSSMGEKRTIALNVRETDATGFDYLTNDVVAAQLRVELEDVPDTPSYRNQQFQLMVELAKSLPPDLQPILADFVVRASDLPFRHELADRIAQHLGLSGGDAGPQDPAKAQAEAAASARQAEMDEMQRVQAQLALQELQAKVDKATAEAERARAQAQQSAVGAMKVQSDIDLGERRTAMEEDLHGLTLDERALKMVQGSQADSQKAMRPPRF